MYKEIKETTHGEIGEKKNIHHYIRNIRTMYVNSGYNTHVQEKKLYLKEKEKKKIH